MAIAVPSVITGIARVGRRTKELVRRLAQRNASFPAGVFRIPERELDEALATFQRPTPEEFTLFDKVPAAPSSP